MPEVIDGKTYYTLNEWKELDLSTRHEIEKDMLFKHLSRFNVDTIKGFLQRVEDGRIDGQSYFSGDPEDPTGCACVLGTLIEESDRSVSPSFSSFKEERNVTDVYVPLTDDPYEKPGESPVERMVFNAYEGDTPDTNDNLRLIRDWTLEYLEVGV